ncbi:Imm50 family immunity protein [Marinobacterium stanieri]|uniref:Imm50 family immunity protein n=1 Tax=Marinobacterium stanieri TaxID=49186 RepID=UPI003A8FA9CD
MNWTDFVLKTEAIKSIYGADLPRLEKLNLHEVTLHHDGPRAILRFDLCNYPNNPPKKWSSLGYNTVQIRLMALGIKSLNISGWGSENNISLSLEKNKDIFILKYLGNNGGLEIAADFLILDKVSAYKNDVFL